MKAVMPQRDYQIGVRGLVVTQQRIARIRPTALTDCGIPSTMASRLSSSLLVVVCFRSEFAGQRCQACARFFRRKTYPTTISGELCARASLSPTEAFTFVLRCRVDLDSDRIPRVMVTKFAATIAWWLNSSDPYTEPDQPPPPRTKLSSCSIAPTPANRRVATRAESSALKTHLRATQPRTMETRIVHRPLAHQQDEGGRWHPTVCELNITARNPSTSLALHKSRDRSKSTLLVTYQLQRTRHRNTKGGFHDESRAQAAQMRNGDAPYSPKWDIESLRVDLGTCSASQLALSSRHEQQLREARR